MERHIQRVDISGLPLKGNDASGGVRKQFVFGLVLLHVCLKEYRLCLLSTHDIKLQKHWKAGLKFQRDELFGDEKKNH